MTDHRHHVAHIEVVNPEDVPRFASLGVVANMQPLWASDDDQMRTLRIPLLGADRASWQIGKLADLVVLDRDLRDRGAGGIGDATVRWTFVEGEEVFSAES